MHFLLLAAEETAAHGGETSKEVLAVGNWLPGLTALVVFGIAFAVLYLKVWPKIAQGLEDRQNKIREEIAAAERARAKANEALAEYEKSLAEARQQADEIIAKARADAKAAAEDLRSKNQAELAHMKERATAEIESAKRSAIVELHQEAANLATVIAGKILHREISVEDQQALVEASLNELAAQRGHEPAEALSS